MLEARAQHKKAVLTPFGVSDQYPPEVQEKCRSLIPKMLEARAQHKKAVLTPFGVFDQYPPEVQEKRRSLIPKMLEARAQHKKAVLVRDKLYIKQVVRAKQRDQW